MVAIFYVKSIFAPAKSLLQAHLLLLDGRAQLRAQQWHFAASLQCPTQKWPGEAQILAGAQWGLPLGLYRTCQGSGRAKGISQASNIVNPDHGQAIAAVDEAGAMAGSWAVQGSQQDVISRAEGLRPTTKFICTPLLAVQYVLRLLSSLPWQRAEKIGVCTESKRPQDPNDFLARPSRTCLYQSVWRSPALSFRLYINPHQNNARWALALTHLLGGCTGGPNSPSCLAFLKRSTYTSSDLGSIHS
jgi:hypothetical protein